MGKKEENTWSDAFLHVVDDRNERKFAERRKNGKKWQKWGKNAKKDTNPAKKGKNRHQLLRIGVKWGFGSFKIVKSVKIGREMVIW